MKHPGPVRAAPARAPAWAAWASPGRWRRRQCDPAMETAINVLLAVLILGGSALLDPLVHPLHVHPLPALRDPERPAENPLPGMFQRLGWGLSRNGRLGL